MARDANAGMSKLDRLFGPPYPDEESYWEAYDAAVARDLAADRARLDAIFAKPWTHAFIGMERSVGRPLKLPPVNEARPVIYFNLLELCVREGMFERGFQWDPPILGDAETWACWADPETWR